MYQAEHSLWDRNLPLPLWESVAIPKTPRNGHTNQPSCTRLVKHASKNHMPYYCDAFSHIFITAYLQRSRNGNSPDAHELMNENDNVAQIHN